MLSGYAHLEEEVANLKIPAVSGRDICCNVRLHLRTNANENACHIHAWVPVFLPPLLDPDVRIKWVWKLRRAPNQICGRCRNARERCAHKKPLSRQKMNVVLRHETPHAQRDCSISVFVSGIASMAKTCWADMKSAFRTKQEFFASAG